MSYMKWLLAVILVVIIGGLVYYILLPPISRGGLIGEYLCVVKDEQCEIGNTLEFRPNGELYYTSGKYTYTGEYTVAGKYEIEGDKITLIIETFGTKAVYRGKIGKNEIILENGCIFKKPRKSIDGKINRGDIIEVVAQTVDVFKQPNGEVKGTVHAGEIGTVTGGPEYAGGLTWWFVIFPQSAGWVAETNGGVLIKEKIDNRFPNKPSNLEPPNGTTGVSLTPTLRASPFSDPDGDSHLKTMWVILVEKDKKLVWNSGWRTYDLTSTKVPSGILQPNTEYEWCVLYMDTSGTSSRSNWTTFTTGSGK
ncbi:hypothetical protein [Candidatus Methanodesulfokora washburnensis]|nr:hypothetical protein [Candidatus Methanodesulfokores washburnensis]